MKNLSKSFVIIQLAVLNILTIMSNVGEPQDRILATKTTNGVYVKSVVGNYMHALFLIDGKETGFYCQDEIIHILDRNKGKNHQITYQLIETYIPEAEKKLQIEVIKNVQLLDDTKSMEDKLDIAGKYYIKENGFNGTLTIKEFSGGNIQFSISTECGQQSHTGYMEGVATLDNNVATFTDNKECKLTIIFNKNTATIKGADKNCRSYIGLNGRIDGKYIRHGIIQNNITTQCIGPKIKGFCLGQNIYDILEVIKSKYNDFIYWSYGNKNFKINSDSINSDSINKVKYELTQCSEENVIYMHSDNTTYAEIEIAITDKLVTSIRCTFSILGVSKMPYKEFVKLFCEKFNIPGMECQNDLIEGDGVYVYNNTNEGYKIIIGGGYMKVKKVSKASDAKFD